MRDRLEDVIKIIQAGAFSTANIKAVRNYFEDNQQEVTSMMVGDKCGAVMEQYIQRMKIQKMKKGYMVFDKDENG